MVWTNASESGSRANGKCACRISASFGKNGDRAAGSSSFRGGTSTTVASPTRVPGGARSVTRCPSATSPRTRAMITRSGPPYPFAGNN